MELYNENCLEKMKDLSDNSVDIVIADLPYGRFKHLTWDCPIDLERMWKQLWRICKATCPIFLFGDFKFAMEIYNSQPKYFKYEIVWNKGRTTTPLLSRKRFGKSTEYILVFYKKQPVYNYAKYHKINNKNVVISPMVMGNDKKMYHSKTRKYNPKLPLNIINENEEPKDYGGIKNVKYYKKGKKWNPKLPLNIINENEIIDSELYNMKFKRSLEVYEPRLPLNIIKCNAKIKNKTIKKVTEKPQFILEHLLKYFSNEGDTCLDITMGSGSCGVACHTLGRKFIGIEKNKEFYEITKERLSSLSSSV